MSIASAPHRTTAHKRKPDPARVVQAYYHQVQTVGKRGAYRRTAVLYGISHETVRRYVLAAEQPKVRTLTPDPLAYVPPPGAYPEPLPTLTTTVNDISTAQTTAQPSADDTCAEPGEVEPLSEPVEHAVMSSLAHDQNDTADSTRHTAELPEGSPEESQMPQEPPIRVPPDWPLPPPEPSAPTGDELPDWNERPSRPDRVPEQQPLTPHQSPAGGDLPEDRPTLPKSAAFYRSEPIVVTRVVRVPVEARRGGLVEWLNDRPGVRNQLLAVAVFLMLVMMTWWG